MGGVSIAHQNDIVVSTLQVHNAYVFVARNPAMIQFEETKKNTIRLNVERHIIERAHKNTSNLHLIKSNVIGALVHLTALKRITLISHIVIIMFLN